MKRLLLILPFLVLLSCSVQKRKYQKGFYVSAQHHKKNNIAVATKKENKNETLALKPVSLFTETNEIDLLAVSATKKPLILNYPLRTKKSLKSNTDSLCDNITLKNGNDIAAKVLEITPTEIKYKKCNVADGPLYVVKKTDVFMVKYANGNKEVFKQENTATQNQPGQANNNTNDNTSNYRGPKKTHSFAILSLVFALLGILSYGLLSAFAIVFANSALEKIKREPNLYKGEMLAKVSRGIAVATIVLLILILIFAFIVLFGII